MATKTDKLLDYPGRGSVPSTNEAAPLAFGIFAAICAAVVVPAFYLFLRQQQGNPFGIAPLIAVIGWGGSNIVGLILGGIGWAIARRSRNRTPYWICIWANVLNWTELGVLAYIFAH